MVVKKDDAKRKICYGDLSVPLRIAVLYSWFGAWLTFWTLILVVGLFLIGLFV